MNYRDHAADEALRDVGLLLDNGVVDTSRPKLFIADDPTVKFSASKPPIRQLRVSRAGWDEPMVFAEGESIEITWTPQGAVAMRRGKPK